MKLARVRQLLLKYMKEISPVSVDFLEEKYSRVLNSLSRKLSKVFSEDKQVEEYLDFVLKEIDRLNSFFLNKKGGSRIPYSMLFAFANKQDRLSSFFFERGAEIRLSKDCNLGVDIAGFNHSFFKEDEIVIIFENDVYGCVYISSQNTFFFSQVVEKLVVQNSKGKIRSYKKYVSSAIKKGRKHISLETIFLSITNNKKNNESAKAFEAFYLKKASERKEK